MLANADSNIHGGWYAGGAERKRLREQREQHHEVSGMRRHHIICDKLKQVQDVSDLSSDVANLNLIL